MTKKSTHKKIHMYSSILFGIVAILHLLRIIFDLPLIIGSYFLPIWVSLVAVLVTAYLSILLYKTSKK